MYNVLPFASKQILAVASLPLSQWQNIIFCPLLLTQASNDFLIALQMIAILLAPSQIFLPVYGSLSNNCHLWLGL